MQNESLSATREHFKSFDSNANLLQGPGIQTARESQNGFLSHRDKRPGEASLNLGTVYTDLNPPPPPAT